jgi:hypothetical protein
MNENIIVGWILSKGTIMYKLKGLKTKMISPKL